MTPTIDPTTQMQLRLHALRTVVFGQDDGTEREDRDQDEKGEGSSTGLSAVSAQSIPGSASVSGTGSSARPSPLSLTVRSQRAQEKLKETVQHDAALRTFLNLYEVNEPYLSSSFLLSGFVPAPSDASPSAEPAMSSEDQGNGNASVPALSPSAQLSLLYELLPAWKTLAAELEECSILEKRNVLDVFDYGPRVPSQPASISASDSAAPNPESTENTASPEETTAPPRPAESAQARNARLPQRRNAERDVETMSKTLDDFRRTKQTVRIADQQAIEKRLSNFLSSYGTYVRIDVIRQTTPS